MNTMPLTPPTTRRSLPQGSLIGTGVPSFRTAADVATVVAAALALTAGIAVAQTARPADVKGIALAAPG